MLSPVFFYIGWGHKAEKFIATLLSHRKRKNLTTMSLYNNSRTSEFLDKTLPCWDISSWLTNRKKFWQTQDPIKKISLDCYSLSC